MPRPKRAVCLKDQMPSKTPMSRQKSLIQVQEAGCDPGEEPQPNH